MPSSIALAVIVAALFHATWNTILKSQPNRFIGILTMMATTTTLGVAGAIYYGAPPQDSLVYLGVSVCLHIAYNFMVVTCYRLGDISHVYPIFRGAAPPIAAAAGYLWLAEVPPLLVCLGIAVISCGVLSMVGGISKNSKAVLAALATACVIASYSVVDAQGARTAGNPVQYLCWLMMLVGPLFALTMLSQRGAWSVAKVRPRHLLLAVAGGILSILAYGLVIYAYTKAQVAAVAALREVSILFGALAGMLLLNEPKPISRIVGTCLIFVGTIIIITHG